ncbi:tetratricopeptide repeat protein [Sorangium sp. So ce861]|uniref:tetratricopeptide repeat protein n=1 Tax=Sorangium sp. So ce861 TaxID=3133323 RepID=UPI003F644841
MVASTAMERRELDGLTREELIARAEGLGVPRPRVLTKAELVDEILARTAQGEPERARLRGFLGRARDLLSRVVERGLHMPETARALRGEPPPEQWPPPPPPPRATTTLAEIYASQGHTDRAIAVLDEILEREPQHEDARQLRERLIEQAQRAQGEGAAAQGAGVGAAEAEDEEAEDEEAEEAEAESAEAGEAGAESAEAKDAGAEAAKDAGAEAAKDAGSSEQPEAPIAGELDRQPEPVPAAPDVEPAQPPREPAPADAPAPAAIAERAVAGATPGLAAALQDERAELPARYDLDEVVGLAVDPETLYVYWEVRPRTLARARARRPGGQLVIRVVAVLPSWERPVVEQRDLAIDALFGDMFVRDIPAGSHLRMCTGWLDGDVFEPFAVGLEVAAPRAVPLAPRSPTPEPDASAQAALHGEVPTHSPAGPTRDARPHLEGAGGDAPSAASGALDAAAASPPLPTAGASGQAGESAAAAYAAGAGSMIAPPPAPSAPAASGAAQPGASEAAPVAGIDVATAAAPPATLDIAAEAAAPAAGRDVAAAAAAPAASSDATTEAAAPAASSDATTEAAAPTPLGDPAADAVSPDLSGPIAPGPALASPGEGPPRFPAGAAPTAEALARAVAATREPPPEGPPRFPSGTAPTAEALAQAVAATRGGSSDLLRGGGESAWPGLVGQPHASEALRRPGAEWSRSLGGASELRAGAAPSRSPGGASELRAGAERSRPTGGGGTELWRSFANPARPPSGSR